MDFKDGQKHGRFIVYDEKGKIISEKKFAFGMEEREGEGSFSPN
jgi:antitoxin component YwqK of YwqJK toxin-antitoxin module